MNELFSLQQYIELVTHYKVEKNKHGFVGVTVITEDEYNKMKADEKLKDKAKSIKTKWKVPNWKVGNDLLEASSFFNPQKNDMDVNWNRYRDQRFKSSLVDWDLKDEKGVAIPVNAETIDLLSQSMAFQLLKQFDEATRITDEADTKNA